MIFVIRSTADLEEGDGERRLPGEIPAEQQAAVAVIADHDQGIDVPVTRVVPVEGHVAVAARERALESGGSRR